MQRWKVLIAEGTVGTFISEVFFKESNPARGALPNVKLRCPCGSVVPFLSTSVQVRGAGAPSLPSLQLSLGPWWGPWHPSQALASCKLCPGNEKAVTGTQLCPQSSQEEGSRCRC